MSHKVARLPTGMKAASLGSGIPRYLEMYASRISLVPHLLVLHLGKDARSAVGSCHRVERRTGFL